MDSEMINERNQNEYWAKSLHKHGNLNDAFDEIFHAVESKQQIKEYDSLPSNYISIHLFEVISSKPNLDVFRNHVKHIYDGILKFICKGGGSTAGRIGFIFERLFVASNDAKSVFASGDKGKGNSMWDDISCLFIQKTSTGGRCLDPETYPYLAIMLEEATSNIVRGLLDNHVIGRLLSRVDAPGRQTLLTTLGKDHLLFHENKFITFMLTDISGVFWGDPKRFAEFGIIRDVVGEDRFQEFAIAHIFAGTDEKKIRISCDYQQIIPVVNPSRIYSHIKLYRAGCIDEISSAFREYAATGKKPVLTDSATNFIESIRTLNIEIEKLPDETFTEQLSENLPWWEAITDVSFCVTRNIIPSDPVKILKIRETYNKIQEIGDQWEKDPSIFNILYHTILGGRMLSNGYSERLDAAILKTKWDCDNIERARISGL